MSENLEALGELTADQQALLLLMLRKKAQARAEQRIPRAPRGQQQPLSFAQERLWFLNQFEPESAYYNLPLALRLTGPLNLAALESTLNELNRRHEVLRTTFKPVNGKPEQYIGAAQPGRLPVTDLVGLTAEQREAVVQNSIIEDARRPFDLEQGPLVRQQVLRVGEAEHMVLLTMHHIVTDNWSMGVMVKEVVALYTAYQSGESSPLQELEIQYADFAAWQREYLQGAVLENELSYWKQQLADAPEVLELPTDRPRPRFESFHGAHQSLNLSESTSRKLTELSQQAGTTLFMTLLAAFKTLLYRYTGQSDLLVGTPVANRNRVEVEPLIGFFVNTLVLRTQLNGDWSFRELLQQVRETVLGAQGHQELPFERLVQELAPERSLSHAPLFQVMMTLDTSPERKLELPQLELQTLGGHNATAKFDLLLGLSTKRNALRGVIEYNADLFDSSRMARLAEHFSALLDAVVEDPEQPIAQLPLLSATERHRLLVEWNDTDSVEPPESCLHELFAAQSQLTPDAIALEFEDETLTYAELNARANQLAHYLRKFGVGPDVLVGLCLEPSLELIIGLLGILKAGGAYLPIDPAYPKERLSFMLADSQTPVIVTQERYTDLTDETRIICLDRDWGLIAREAESDIDSGVSPDNLAYVMYTSGSTGVPKGVSVNHRAVVRLVQEPNYAELNASHTFLQLAPVSFDASTLEIWGSLLNGARLALMKGGTPSLQELGTALRRYHVTTLWLTAGLFHLMVDQQLEDLQQLEQLLAGGDVLSVAHVRRFLETARGKLINGYGPTENTTFTTCQPLTEVAAIDGTVPIGRPITNTRVYVLDGELQLVPMGAMGELYTSGDGLARGYFNRASLTAERFIPNPFNPGERLYKTGDQVRHLAGGEVEFIGRADQQVKLRGFRIELGEIEAALTHAEGVRQAVVLLREDTAGDKRLVAYLVPEVEESFSTAELRRQLQTALPDYMVPSTFVMLDELPLNANGKINRKALPVPESTGATSGYVAPRTPTEQIVADIWAEVLKVEQVGVEDNFFDLGGHSLLAAQLISRLRTACKVELQLRALFEAGTVAALAELIEKEAQHELALLPPLVSVDRAGSLPLSFAQERLWFLDQFEPESAYYNLPLALRLRGPLNLAALESTLNEVSRRHEVLRTTFKRVNGKPEQVIGAVQAQPLPVTDLVGLTAEQREAAVQKVIKEDARTPFDLGRGPLVRQQLLRVGEAEHVVLLTMHHIVTDGWSMGVMVKEVVSLYTAYQGGASSPLPELEIQYADFAVWQRDYLQGEVLENELSYWKQQLAAAPEVLELPTDRPRPRVETFRGAYQSLRWDEETAQRLTALNQQAGTTLFMTLLAAFKTVLYRYTGKNDLLVGTPVANRDREEIEPLIGFFSNTLVLRTKLNGNGSFAELLQQVREVVLGAQGHQKLPFERLVQELAPERSLSHAPLFQVILALNNPTVGKLELPQLELQAVLGDSATAKFDLTVVLSSRERGISGLIIYNRDLFGAPKMAQLAGHFTRVVESISQDASQKLWQVEMLSESERYQLLVSWNDTQVETVQSQLLPELFATQVEQYRDALALSFQDEQLSYGELDRRSNQVARWLQQMGVGPEVLVGLFTERSLEMVIGIFGVLKAGGAYVPLDPNYPKDRLAYMLEQARPRLLLTQERLLGRLPQHGAQVVCLDTDWEQMAAQHDGEIETTDLVPENPAYVIYTSGSTGQPKGVVIHHRGLLNYLHWARQAYPVTEGFAVPVQSSLSFDLTVTSLLLPLVCGQQVVLLPEAEGAGALGQALATDTDWSLVKLTPANLGLLSNQLSPQQAAGRVRMFVVGGEELRWEQLRFWQQHAASTRVINEYGPTETVVGCCVYEAGAESGREAGVPIGRPVANTRLYVLNRDWQPVPIGVSGELWIGGLGVARGYLERPELTAAVFVPDSFSGEAGGRLYRTGDLARYRPDGVLEYLGRIDHQVKLRGFRIELGEVEAALTRADGVRQAVALMRELAPGDKRLVAYVVPEVEESFSTTELRRHLQTALPDYMMPAAFVVLSELPLTANGKVNRRALPVPKTTGTSSGYVAPRTPIEQIVADIWAEVLKVEQVGVEDNFFERGGHSLLAAQVISRLRTACKVELQLRALFEAGTVAALALLIDDKSQDALAALPPLVAVKRDGLLPLSFAQERLWFLDQFEPDSAFYNIPMALRLRGALNVAALESTLSEMIRRHEVLRTTFKRVDGKPEQVIGVAQPGRLPVTDLIGLTAEQREAAVQKVIKEDARTPFDLGRGPLLRQQVLRVGEAEHVVLLTMHHIVTDNWSTSVMVKEVMSLYTAYQGGASSPLPELEIQYADFAVWQRDYLQGEVLENELSYWKQQLAAAPEVLELPTDRPRPRVETFRGAYQSLRWDEETAQRLTALNQQAGTTLFMTLLAAFKTVLYRYTGKNDLLVGTPVASRDREEIEPLIGFFSNTLVLRTKLNGNGSFAELLQQVREVVLGAQGHQKLPFERLVQELAPERSLSHAPLFQVILALNNPTVGKLELPQLELQAVLGDSATAKFDLTVVLSSRERGISGLIIYNRDLFGAPKMAQLAGHFTRVVESISQDASQKLWQVEMLSESERYQLLVSWNDTQVETVQSQLLPELFATQVEQYRDALALSFQDEQLSYGELDRRSNQVARWLQQMGVGPEVLVGLFTERSLEMVIGIFGVLKAGGAYVPLDPNYPKDRLAYMLEQARPRLLLTQERLLGRLPQHGAQVVCLDTDWEQMAAQHDGEIETTDLVPENPAYVIYTSGSTGQPKGVVIHHRGLLNYLHWARQAYPVTEGFAVPVQSSLSFDLTVTSLLLPLVCGQQVVLLPEAEGAGALGQALATDTDWSLVKLTPANLGLLSNQLSPQQAAGRVRMFVVGGEELRWEQLRFWQQHAASTRVINEYGPTETVVGCCVYEAGAESGREAGVPIGRPVANTRLYVLNRDWQPVPIGVSGELWIGGLGVARGYLERPELTAAVFVPDSFSGEAGGRLYRTGDLARYRPDGVLEYLGRIDHQVKLRGFRIELGEVEAALTRADGVRQAVALMRELAPGDKRLVAYVVPEVEESFSTTELRRHLQTALPDYMMPAAFVVLSELPLTANGKVNRRALPVPKTTGTSSGYVAPRTPIEQIVADIWAEVLKVEQVGVEDNFFERGGHSLLAAQVISRLRTACKVELQLRALFEAGTVAALALLIDDKSQDALAALPPLVAVKRDGLLPLSFAQERLWFLDQFEPDSAFYNIPIALSLRGALNVAALESTLNELMRRHESLRTIFVENGGEPGQQIRGDLKQDLPLVDLQGLTVNEQQEQAERLTREDARRPFNLDQAPLRVNLLRLSEQQHQFLYTMHHIVSDGWSMGVLVKEVGTLYEAHQRGELSPLPELEIQYADFAAWQREWLQGEVLENELSYWKQQLADAPEVLELPTDRPRPRVESFRGAYQSLSLSESTSRRLTDLSQQQGTTLFMTLLAAFKTLLYRYTGQSDILVGTPVANRNRVEAEPLIGFFVNTLVVRTRMTPESSFRELLQQVRETVLGAQGHQELPFERLVQELAPERSLSHAPLFQVMMTLDTSSERKLELPQLELQSLGGTNATAKFDLLLGLSTKRDELRGVIEYKADLFDSNRMARFAEHFNALLEAVVEDPEQPIAQLPLLSAAERHRLLVEWNDTERICWSYCIHELFAEQVRQRPDAVAVVFDNQQISYAELDVRSNDLAHRLRQLGVGVESCVAICVKRSIEMIVGLVGILKAGAIYVPLDADYPTERLSFMLNNSQIAALLMHDKTVARMRELAAPQNTSIPQLNLDEQIITNESPITLDASFYSGEQLACILYTSGSTGQPKGVSITHQSVARLVNGDWMRFSPNGIHLQLNSLSFDTVTVEIWGALLHGGRVTIMPPGPPSVEELARLVKRDQVTMVVLTSALFNLMVQEQPAALASVRDVLPGGEALSIAHVHSHLAAMAAAEPGVSDQYRLLNVYGPTEVTTFSTTEAMTTRTPAPATISIGRPIANTTCYVLDSRLQPVAAGVYGELYLGGLRLARGYYGQTSLTSERFVPDLFGNTPGARLYRTGDIVRQLADGRLEFFGRTDHQIKLRGFRIELGEIESALTHAEGVSQAVVLLREDTPGYKRLVAYVVPEAETPESFLVAELRRHLQTTLPDYMVPSFFVLLTELPLNANGKVDRKALPEPETSSDAAGYVAPRTPTEQIVADIWCEVLKLKQVGVEDNFFELGGHSLLAAQVTARVRTKLELELPLRWLFESPTVMELSERIDDARQSETGVAMPPIAPALREGPMPLSFAQERLWLVDQLDTGSSVYNLSMAVRLEGSLQTTALEQSLAELVRRHESLRTCFVEIDGQPVQVTADTMTVPLPIVNSSGVSVDATSQVVKEESTRPFDLARLPLLRARLVQLSSREHALVLTLHHIITDGWSMRVLVDEVTSLYKAFSSGEPSPLGELALQYADYSAWQRRWLQGEVLDQLLHYWKQQLEGAPEVLELPLDQPRPQTRKYRGAVQTRRLSADLSEQLTALSQRSGSTLFMTLLAVFQLMLSRYSGQEDIVVGVPSAGRNRTELEGQIGFFINTLALRTDLSGNPSFLELLARVRKVALEGFAHQDAPFEKLLEELQVQRDLSRTPLLQVFFNMVNLPNQTVELSELRVTPLIPEAGAKFDLEFYIVDTGEGLGFNLVYDADLFKSERMIEMVAQFERLLEQIVAEPEQAISEFSLVTRASRAVLPDATISLPEPEHEPITETFFSIAERHPEHEAICAEGRSWNYSELSQRAKSIAQFLLNDGLTRGDVVAVSGTPSFDLIASLLGVMTAGGVILPLDPNLPESRRELMVCEADARRLLIANELPQVPTASATEKLPEIDPDDPAYIFFTSGTTGVPKAVLGCHKGLAHFLHWQRSTFAIGPDDRCAQLTALSFDVVMRDIFLALTSGASLYVPDSPDSILSWLDHERITVIHTVPSLVQSWLNDVPAGVTLNALRYSFLAGEPLADSLVRRWRAQFPESGSIVNLYGPTETTLAKCFYVVPQEPSFGMQPVGSPLPETQALVLNSGSGLCGIGERGEITIRTPFRTLGYLNQPDETIKRFVQNPLGENKRDDEEDVIYKTGDLGRYRLDGSVEIVGRVDDQIKIRGVRIEPNEVTAVLLQHSKVQSGAVVGYKDAEGNYALAAYVVAAEGERIATELRAFLSRQLPAAMVPSSFIFIDELPLTANGKLDRRKLPVPDISRAQIEPVTPRSWTEEVLAGMWAEVLRRDRIGVHEDFFELGGHSLLATQVIARVRHAFHVELPLRRLFERPTVALLAETIDESLRGKADLAVPAIEPVLRDAPLPLSFAQERLWFLQQLQPESFAYNMTAWIDLTGPLNIVALDQATTEIMRRHEILRTSFATADGQPVQVVGPPPRPVLTVVDLSGLSHEEQEAQAQSLSREQAHRPFDLASGPIFRGVLLRLDDAHHSLLLAMHHVAGDAWSNTIFTYELGTLYGSFFKGEQSQLSELAIQYVDFAAWQRGWLQGEVLDTQLGYWKRQLRNSPPMLELPTDRPRPPIQTFRGETATLHVAEELTSRLVALSRRNGATLFMTLMAVFQTLLYRYTGSEDVVVGTGIAERKSVELERMMGLFINQLAIRTQLSGQQTFAELLQNVRDTSLAAYAHQDLPFEKLVAELQPERSLSRSPFFQVMLMMQTAPNKGANLTEVAARVRTRETGGAKFDLTMHVLPALTELQIILEYNTVLFDANRVSRLLGHFHSLLEAVATQPEQRLCDLQMLTVSERSQLLVDWNKTDAPYRMDVYLHELIEAQSEKTPDAIAIEFEDAKLTYGELNARANQLARYLTSLGVEAESLVGLAVERSLEMLIGLLGVLKAGAAYLPLDPDYPQSRLNYMLEDAQAQVLLTQAHLQEKTALGESKVVCLDRDWQLIAQQERTNLALPVKPEQLAYIIYTSGSTGGPKGVMVSHGALINFLHSMRQQPGLTASDRLLAVTTLSFDIAGLELYLPLTVGAQVELVSREALLVPVKLRERLEQSTVMQATPSLWRLLIDSGKWVRRGQYKLLCGGEALPRQLAQQLVERSAALWNMYGPTETTIWSSVEHVSVNGEAYQTIGRPIANTQFYILDKSLQPVPVGVSGELYIGGAGVARGYLRRPELTAERFIPNYFSGAAGERCYNTGDLARYLPDGRVEYLGRADHQVKVRGFRIELGEVEVVLRQHPQIKENVVVVREDEPGDRRLVAYLVTDSEISIGDLRSFLSKKLPDYMIPSAFVRLDALPLTANGKVDRKALPQPGDPSSRARHKYVAPRAELERNLVKIWQQLLRVETVGVEDNFFDLGGHSLLLVRLVQEIQDSLGLEVVLMEMFEHPTVASLARHLITKQTEVQQQTTAPTAADAPDEAEGRRRRRLKRLKASDNS